MSIKKIFLLIIFAELLSFLGHYYQPVNFIAFFAIAVLALALTLYRPRYGLFILLTELIIGSFGYLFYFETGGFKISWRIALWLIVMSVWLAKATLNIIKTKKINILFFKSDYANYFLILFIFIFWGAVSGLLNGNSINNIFFDFNNWLYFLLVFPIFELTRDQKFINGIKLIFIAAISWLSLKTLILAYFFTHNFNFFTLDLYRWVRDSGAGEITPVVTGFSRVFMQSQLFILIGFFILLFYLLNHINKPNTKNKMLDAKCLTLTTLFLSAIIISFSRSFWVGLAAGGLFVWLTTIFKLKIKFKQFLKFNSFIFISIILGLALSAAVIKFPFPAPPAGLDAPGALSERATKLTGEAGASSRWQLLAPLGEKIKTAPVIGRGFGATVTYKSSDPRVIQSSPGGLYTTYAFEWGWLDVWLKLGILGPLAYSALLIKLIIDGVKANNYLSSALAAGLFVLAAVNVFSPYINHPLGIGYLIVAAALMENFKKTAPP
ncbi:MAG: hypothetical protein Q8O93_00245 [bacterium]|nr:hypothetical protein [bacterium]